MSEAIATATEPLVVRIDGVVFQMVEELSLGEIARLEAHFRIPAAELTKLPTLATFSVAWASANRGTPGGVTIDEILAAQLIELPEEPKTELPTDASVEQTPDVPALTGAPSGDPSSPDSTGYIPG